MTTERLYYNDPYTLGFSADVVEQTTFKQKPALVLDRTYFYPEGGGQPADNGAINGVGVIDVQTRESDRAVLHVLENKLDDQHIEGQINAARRTDYMHHHSAQHILSQALSQAAHAETVSVHMSADSMTIDVNRVNLTPEEWLAVEELANRIILENRAVRTWFPDPDELASLHLRKLPDVVGKVRIVDIGGFDITACGGTHVARTGELGLIKVVRFERRGETTRLEFKSGSRALTDYRDKNAVINTLASEMTVGYRDLHESIKRIQAENKALKADLKTAKEQLIAAEALALLPSAAHFNDWQIVAHAFQERDIAEVKLLAQKLSAQPGTIALLGSAGEKAQLVFGRAENVPLDIVPILKTALGYLKTERGGGTPALAQGGGVAASVEDVTTALRLAEQSIRQQK